MTAAATTSVKKNRAQGLTAALELVIVHRNIVALHNPC